MGRTQLGNNNAYCHDGPLTWVNWDLNPLQKQLLAFAREVFAIRAANPVLRRRNFFTHEERGPGRGKDLTWISPDGSEMSPEVWNKASNHVLGMLIRGEATDEIDEQGRKLLGEAILLLVNGGGRSQHFELPVIEGQGSWSAMLDTAHVPPRGVESGAVSVAPHSMLLLRSDNQR
jgi:glycogen operon protein